MARGRTSGRCRLAWVLNQPGTVQKGTVRWALGVAREVGLIHEERGD